MKKPNQENTVDPYSEVPEERWPKKKNALLERLSKDTSAVKLDKKNLIAERNRLATEIERLEEENNTVAKQLRDLQSELLKKRTAVKEVFERSDALKRKLVGLLAKKRGFLNEIEFYETEKVSLSEKYLKVSESLSNNVSTLNSTLKNLDFMKGEVKALMGKMAMLEGEIPVKKRDRGNLDEKIERTLNLLNEFYDRMQRVERTIKENYYIKNKKNE
jgi:chromosome segregation ATPase